MHLGKWKSAVHVAMRSFSTRNVKPMSSVMLEIEDEPGALHKVLDFFKKHKVSMSHIESKPSVGESHNYNISVDFQGKPSDSKNEKLLGDLKQSCVSVLVMNEKLVPWFPKKIADLDMSVGQTLDAGTELNSDHLGFNDKEYRKRRDLLTESAMKFRQGDAIPRIDYTQDEIKTWGVVYDRMIDMWDKYACDEFKYILPLLQTNCGYANDNIPQQEDISTFLKECTGFTLRPVAGLLTSRDFLNGLAFRVFFSTQYIRHHSMPLYTPEPDICHELMGHAPMFADPDFADFSHEIGLASLGASDDEILRLATCYWYSVEFGLIRQNGKLKAYGAGLLSSFGEIEYACSPTRPAGGKSELPEYRPWDPNAACKQTYPITDYQPIYYVADNLCQAKQNMRQFCESLQRPFHAKYHPLTQSVSVDRAVKRSLKDA